jgi:hypothetical protein
MKITLFAAACALLALPAQANLLTWQAEVGTGTAPAVTHFSTVSGAAPITINVGALSGDRSFEFIYNSVPGSPSQAFLGSQDPASGQQGLKLDQWNASGVFGMTDFGVTDFYSSVTSLWSQDVHIVFTSDGVDTQMYVNGAAVQLFSGVDLTITGLNALGAADNSTHTGYFDNMLGNVLGFASYDTQLSPAEVSAHYGAFTVPEPGVSVLALLAGLGLVRRRR